MELTLRLLNNHIEDYRFHNLPLDTERAIEIPFIWDIVLRYDPQDVLEVGNVLMNYVDIAHDVVDLYEQNPRVVNADIRTYKPDKKYKLIVSVTTLEHVGDGKDGSDFDEFGIIHAIDNMLEMLTPDGRIVFTVPIAQNKAMDKLFFEGKIPGYIRYIKRINEANDWKEAGYEEIKDTILYYPYKGSNASIVCMIYNQFSGIRVTKL